MIYSTNVPQISKYKAAVATEQEHTEEVKLQLEQETHNRVLAEDKLKDVKVITNDSQDWLVL